MHLSLATVFSVSDSKFCINQLYRGKHLDQHHHSSVADKPRVRLGRGGRHHQLIEARGRVGSHQVHSVLVRRLHVDQRLLGGHHGAVLDPGGGVELHSHCPRASSSNVSHA